MPAAPPQPTNETLCPTEQAGVVEAVRDARAAETPVYPVGGGTALGFGLAIKRAGLRLSTAGLTRVVDYPARDMTITVEAGMTFAELTTTLAAENQFVPLDVAQPQAATIGGVMAVNFSGPRRYGYGTFRDYVIGMSAVDGTGTLFKAGGRVVKNVAGYDFCKLLTGSLGTLAVVTQVTLKVRPRPTSSAVVVYEADDYDVVERLLAAVAATRTTPVALDLRATKPRPELLVGFEGTAAEVEWQVAQIDGEWRSLGGRQVRTHEGAEAAECFRTLTEFGCDPGATVLKLNVRPSRVTSIVRRLEQWLPQATILARAGNGIVLVRSDDLNAASAAKLLIREIRPAAAEAGGQAIVWNAPPADDWTPQAYWGPTRDDAAVMQTVKRQFDPANILNPGRYFFG